MEMKDKLTKNHRTGFYYKSKKIAVAFTSLFALIAVIGIPTYITLNNVNNEAISKAENVEENNDQVTLEEFDSNHD